MNDNSPLIAKPGQPKRGLQVGHLQDKVVIGNGETIFATFEPSEAAMLAAMLIKHCALLVSGTKIVEAAADELYPKAEAPRILPLKPPGLS